MKSNLTEQIYTLIQNDDATTKLTTAITNSGNALVTVIKSAATVISLVTSSAAGIVLLVICISTAIKSRRGNEDAWGDAMQTIASVAAILCFSAAVMAMFF